MTATPSIFCQNKALSCFDGLNKLMKMDVKHVRGAAMCNSYTHVHILFDVMYFFSENEVKFLQYEEKSDFIMALVANQH